MTSTVLKTLSLATLSLVLLSGCESTKNTFSKMSWPKMDFASKKNSASLPNRCPQVSLMPDLGRIVQMRGNEVVSETIINAISPTCNEGTDTLTIRLANEFKGQLGPAGIRDAKVEATYSIPYLVAVINPKGEIIAKDIFAVTLVYRGGQTEQSFTDLLEQTITLPKGENIEDYKIMLGFQLTPEELAFNRSLALKNAGK